MTASDFEDAGGAGGAGVPRRLGWAVGAILVAAVALRVVFALRKGLVLDEFHSYYHATRASVGALLATLRLDNHPPASFLAIRGARAVLGDGELALRLPALLFGGLELALVASITRRLGSGAPWLAVALLGASSLHLDFSTQARMYALLALAVTGLVEALAAALATPAGEPARGAQVRAALWVAVGLHAHYFFVQYLFWIAVAVALACTSSSNRARTRRLALPALAGALLALPWYLTGLREQLGHALPPGGDDLGPAALAEAFVHLFFLNLRLGGPALRLVFIGSGGLALVLGALGLARLLRRPEPAQRALALVLGTVAFGVPVLASVTAALFHRAGFTWHYVLPSAAALAVLIASPGGGGAYRRAGVGLVLASALLLSLLNAASRGTEDYPAAVRALLDEYRPGDAVVSVEWQPRLFPQGQPWDYYAPRLAEGEPPARLEMAELVPAQPGEVRSAERVLVLRTSLPEDQHLMRWLAERHREVRRRNFGFGVDVLLFERTPDR